MRRKKLVVAIIIIVLIPVVIVFAPVVQVDSNVPNSNGLVTVTQVVTNQTTIVTTTATMIQDNLGIYSAEASISFCLWGKGSLLLNGTYYPFITPHLRQAGAFCPALRPKS